MRPPSLRGLRADHAASLGVLALFAHEYDSEAQTEPGPTVDGLSVRAVGSGERPLYHRSSALYGFLTLPPLAGPHRIHLRDPSERFLPRAVEVVVPDRGEIRRRIFAGAQVIPAEPRPRYLSVPMRSAVGRRLPDGETLLWGVATDSVTGRPLPFTRVEVDAAGGMVATYTDLQGVYVARLRGERVTFEVPEAAEGEPLPPEEDGPPPPGEEEEHPTVLIDEFERAVRFYRLREPIPSERDPLFAFPHRFDEMTTAPALRDAAYLPAVAAGPPLPTITVGRRTRLDVQLAPSPP